MAKYTFTLTVEYNDDQDADAIGYAIDALLETALSTPGILDEYGNPEVGHTRGELQHLLEQPDTDDATYILRQVYKQLGLPIPGFLEVD